jgi:chromosome segregation ATPase
MNSLDISIKETELGFMELNHMISTGFDSENISYFEAGDSGKSDSIVKKAIDKIRKIFETIKKRITEFFDGQRVKNQSAKLEEAMKKDPSLKNKKIKVPNRKKQEDLINETQKRIMNAKTPEEAKKIMEEYDKKKKQVFGVAAAATITITAAAAWLLHGKNKEIKDINATQAKTESLLKEAGNKLEQSRLENKGLQDKNKEKQRENSNLTEKLRDAQKKNTELFDKLKKSGLQNAHLACDNDRLQEKYSNLRDKYDDATDRLYLINAQCDGVHTLTLDNQRGIVGFVKSIISASEDVLGSVGGAKDLNNRADVLKDGGKVTNIKKYNAREEVASAKLWEKDK